MRRRISVAFAFGLLGSAAAQQYVISTFAGMGGVPAQLARGASLGFPIAVTADPTGAVYFGSANFNSMLHWMRMGRSREWRETGSHPEKPAGETWGRLPPSMPAACTRFPMAPK